jgi:hypothetical protein
MKVAPFLGVWALDPAESRYEVGDPPNRAVYIIEGDDERLAFHVDYDLGGLEMTITYITPPDGVPHDYDDVNGIVDRLITTVIDERSLETTSWSDGSEIAHAIREVDEAGSAMTIRQSGTSGDGKRFCNVSVYRKVNA